MKRTDRVLSALLAGTVLSVASSASWAESAVTDPPAFFGALINPQASGAKVSGMLTVSLDLGADDPRCEELIIKNMFVVTALEGPIVTTAEGPNKFGSFSRDFTDHRGERPDTQPFCLIDRPAQINFVLALFREEVIPYYFAPCTPGDTCPSFEVKDIRNFFQSGRGAYSMEITLSVEDRNK